MAPVYDSCTVDGQELWRFRTQIQVFQGKAPYKYSRYLWLTKEDATCDEPLFRYLKDRSRNSPAGKPKIPTPPDGNEWFVNIIPDVSWQPIRDYLEALKNVVTPPLGSIKRKYNQRASSVDASIHKYRSRKQIASGVPVVREEMSAEMVVDTTTSNALPTSANLSLDSAPMVIESNDILNGMVIESATSNKISPNSAMSTYLLSANAGTMRKNWNDLKHRRQIFIQAVMTEGIKEMWRQLAPGHSISELVEVLSGSDIDTSHDKVVTKALRYAYANSIDTKNKELQVQLLSIFASEKDMNRKKLADLFGVTDIAYKSFRNADFHARNHGAGEVVEEVVHERNVENKIEIRKLFVDYLIDQGIMTYII
jgi:hypothetical protein